MTSGTRKNETESEILPACVISLEGASTQPKGKAKFVFQNG